MAIGTLIRAISVAAALMAQAFLIPWALDPLAFGDGWENFGVAPIAD